MNQRGVTLIELLMALVITSFLMAGVYQVVVRQGRVYSAQEQVVDVQQSVRVAMDHMVRDIRMAGYDNDSSTSRIVIPDPVTTGSSQLSLSYEYDETTEHTVTYRLNGDQLAKQLTATTDTGVSNSTEEIVLEGVEGLDFSYGLDTDNDGVLNTWVPASGVTSKVIAIRVRLSARPLSSDLNHFSSRELESVVTLRNRIL